MARTVRAWSVFPKNFWTVDLE
jgi:hypothetical protein